MAEYVAASEETEVIEILRDYLTKKAEIHLDDNGKDGIIRREWNRLNRKFMKKEFDGGRRDFWGVIVDDTGYPIEDKNDPSFLLDYKIIQVGYAKMHLEHSGDMSNSDVKEELKSFEELHNKLIEERKKYQEGN